MRRRRLRGALRFFTEPPRSSRSATSRQSDVFLVFGRARNDRQPLYPIKAPLRPRVSDVPR